VTPNDGPTSEIPSAFSPEKRKRKLARRLVLALALAAFAVVGYGMLSRASRSSGRSRTSSAAAVEDPATLVPLTLASPTPDADEIFGTRIMRFVIELNRAAKEGHANDAELARSEAALSADATRTALGERAGAALQAVVVAAKEAIHARADDEPSVTVLDVAVAHLDNALIAGKLPYFVDASVVRSRDRTRRLVLLYEFTIAGSSLYAGDAARVRTVRVRRADHLNWSQSVLGFVNVNRAQAVVLLDQVDEQLARHVLPALADSAPMPLVAGKTGNVLPQSAVWNAMGERAGVDARAELGDLDDVGPAAARELGEALRARRDLATPYGVETDGLAAHDDGEAQRAIQERLDRPDVASAYAALRDAFAASVERHEAQHRLDALHVLRMPAQVEQLVRGDSPAVEDIRDAVKNELSAYLAQIARDDRTPRTTFTLLVRFLVNPRTRGSTESFVAVIATEEIAKELGIAGASPLLARSRLDEARLIEAHRSVTAVPAAALTAAARKVWARLFGRELATLTLLR